MSGIDYYFWINSDWAYLGADRLQAIGARYGVPIAYKPVDLLDVYARTGGIPLGQRSPERQAYREAELTRWMRRLGTEVNITPRFMCPNGDLASAFVIAAEALGHDVAALHKAVLHAEWCLDLDISEPDTLLAIAQAQGLPGKDILEKASHEDVIRTYRRYTDEAVARGVFGSPAYVYRNEVFWGQDRLEFLEEAIATVPA